MASGTPFGQERPPLSDLIKGILNRYQDVQIFKEMIQNADDAGAKTVWFYVDERQHGSSNLPLADLAKFQGPALVAANDACFTEEDWKGIRRLFKSIKAEDPFRVGRFGIGFNSVYHLTDLPIIVSGNTLAFLDPQEKLWREGSIPMPGRQFTLDDLHHSSITASLDGLADFDKTSSCYPNTIFRLPLRNSPSELSQKVYSIDKVQKLLDTLKKEAKFLLLFLKSVNRIEVMHVNQEGVHTLSFCVSVDSASELNQKRRKLLDQLHAIYSQSCPMSGSVYQFVTYCTTTLSDNSAESTTTKWLVANRVGSEDTNVLEEAKDLRIFPWVGVALEIIPNPDGGRVFCFLPLSNECSDLPVHVNGTFSVNDDRRSVNWSSLECSNDKMADWNHILVSKLLPECYFQLLLEARNLKLLTADQFYHTWPDPNKLQDTNWNGLLKPLFEKIFQECLLSSTSAQWVKVQEAVFVKKGKHLEDVVSKVLTACGCKVVDIPEIVWNALDVTLNQKSVHVITPSLVRTKLHNNKSAYDKESTANKLKLLQYCLSDEDYSDLEGLALVPLANGEFTTFNAPSSCYVCSEEFPQDLLPRKIDHLLVSVSDEKLQQTLLDIAKMNLTQLKLLTAPIVAKLLPSCFPPDWHRSSTISLPCASFPSEWFKRFWKWVQKYDLSLFEGLPVLPLATQEIANGFQVTKLTVLSSSKVIFISEDCPCEKLNALQKLQVHCTVSKYVKYVEHPSLSHYVHRSTNPCGILSATANANPNPTNIQTISFEQPEAELLQNLLSSRGMGRLNSSQKTVLLNLPIFQALNRTRLSINQAIVKSWDNEPVLEPPKLLITPANLPRNLVVFSRSQNQVSLFQYLVTNVSQPSNMGTFVQRHIFPMIENGNFPDSKIDAIMKDILDSLPVLKVQTGDSITAYIKSLSFLRTESRCRLAPEKLYDPTNVEVMKIFEGESVFPLAPFGKDEIYLCTLRECGLRTSVQAQELIDLLISITDRCTGSLQRVSSLKFSRVNGVLDYISSHPVILSENVTYSRCKPMPLKQILKMISKQYNCLPVISARPVGYPKALLWKGNQFSSSLASLRTSVVVHGDEALVDMASIVGSQMCVVKIPSELKKVMPTSFSAEAALTHFKYVISEASRLKTRALKTIVHRVYQYMLKHVDELQSMDLCHEKWIWLEKEKKFVQSNLVFLKEEHSAFNSDLVKPYIYQLPEELHQYSLLFTKFGMCESLSSSRIISVLKMIKEDETENVPQEKLWLIVEHILRWLTEDGQETASNKLSGSDVLLVPVESASERPQLEEISEVVYTDLDFLKSFHSSKDKALKFIHKRVSHLARPLGVKGLSEQLQISENAFGNVGPHEPLISRIKSILTDYTNGLTIIKELIQNADDAGATEVDICYDTRSHCTDSSKLLFPGMANCHGPALLVHNNAVFSKDDFDSITELGGMKKKQNREHIKIGKFGVGFCSVYHITDVPSFVSRDWLYIFDPTVKCMQQEIEDKARPGKKLRILEEVVRHSNQLDPYAGLFGFEQSKSYEGTLFRFPFRKEPSNLSKVIYDDDLVKELVKEIDEAGSKLLLFLKNVKRITFSRINKCETVTKLTQVLEIEKKNVSTVISSATNTLGCAELLSVSIKDHRRDPSVIKQEMWLSSTYKDMVTSKGCPTVGTCSTACPISTINSYRFPNKIDGEMFCFLPLSKVSTGLPVHVSSNFAVTNDRRGIHAYTSDQTDLSTSSEAQWNSDLMCIVIPKAYHTLLLAVKTMCDEGSLSTENFNFASLWPLRESLRSKDPWERMIQPVYQLIMDSQLLHSSCTRKWLCLKEAKLLSTNILCSAQIRSTPDCVTKVIEELHYPLVSLDKSYQNQFSRKDISRCTIDEEDFLRIFFSNIDRLSTEVRNDVLFSLLLTYAETMSENSIPSKPHLETCLRENKCIPCAPDGLQLKFCSEVIHPDSPFAKLYNPEDSVFPTRRYHSRILQIPLSNLGIILRKLPWDMVIERSKSIQNLYKKDKMKALERVGIILQCIEDNLQQQKLVLHTGAEIGPSCLPLRAEQLTQIKFLPVIDCPPVNYPDRITWHGKGHTLLSSQEVICGVRHSRLAGSKAAIVNESSVKSGGCGRIPNGALHSLGIKIEPRYSMVVNHLCHLALVLPQDKEQINKEWIEETCSEIYKFLETQLSIGKITGSDLNELKKTKCLWTGQEFVSPSSVAINWKLNGPHLFQLPHVLQSRQNLIKALSIQERFGKSQLLDVLKLVRDQSHGGKITQRELKLSICIAAELNDLIENELEQEILCYLPDQERRMRRTDVLVCNNAPWCTIEDNIYIVHDDVPMKTAIKLGAQPVQERAMEAYESRYQYYDGVGFGQHEELTQRIRNILNEYCFNESVVRELLQNADDAKASKMYVILDKRSHGTERLPSDAWKDLQGPALLVWNDKVFFKKDFEGIQDLGLGSKRSDAETIGQYGIGFNVVYHLTDCPSFLSNGDTLCVLDPQMKYVPRSRKPTPGRRYDVDKTFWNKWSDLKAPYIREGLCDCPEEIQRGGSMFRFPLRHTDELLEKSDLIDKNPGFRQLEQGAGVLSAQKMEKLLRQWAPKLKDTLIFLNHVNEMKFFVIDNSHRMQLMFNYKVDLDQQARTKTDSYQPSLASHELTLSETVPKQESEKWFVQFGFGDCMKPDQSWEFLSQIKPKHAIATPVHRKTFEGKVFCFLPLPMASSLPVHVHGSFILDSARSGLWKSRDKDHPDKRTEWNNNLIEAIASSYSKFLIDIQRSCLWQKPYTDKGMLSEDLKIYYKRFPSWKLSRRPDRKTSSSVKVVTSHVQVSPVSMEANEIDSEVMSKPESDMGTLARLTFRKIHKQSLKVLSVIKSLNIEGGSEPGRVADKSVSCEQSIYYVDWNPLFNCIQPSNQVYFLSEKCDTQLAQILERIGMVLTAAPIGIKEHFLDIDVELPESDPESVFKYYCKFNRRVSESYPCRIQDTAFQTVGDFKRFTRYVLKVDKGESGFPNSPFKYPLLLTADEKLCIFDDEKKAMCIPAEYANLFKNCGHRFVHPEFTELKYKESYFLEPLCKPSKKKSKQVQVLSCSKNWTDIQEILTAALPQSLHKVQMVDNSSKCYSHDQLKLLWKCLVEEPLFTEHLLQIVEQWALFLSKGDKLYSYTKASYPTSDQVLPMIPPDFKFLYHSTHSMLWSSPVYELLKEHGLPVLDTNVCNVRMCERFCPHFNEPEKILNTIHHLHSNGQLKSLFQSDVLDVHVQSLFRYLAGINFKTDQDLLCRVKSLPLFKDVNNHYRSIKKTLYMWPEIVCKSGNNRWLPLQVDTVFLTAIGPWNSLTSKSELGMEEIDPLTLYIKFIFPNFKLLSHEERVAQLQCIRDTEELFITPYSDSKNDDLEGTERKKAAVEFISELKQLSCFTQCQKLKPVCEFCDPTAEIFKAFPENIFFLPKELTDDAWLSFFRKIGLRTLPTKEEFIEFCEKVSSEETKNLVSASETLVNCLFANEEWHTDLEFLGKVSSISFVCAQEMPKLTWIKGACAIKQGEKTVRLTTLKGSVKSRTRPCNEKLIWTVKPVVRLPGLPYLGLPHDVKEKSDRFIHSIGIIKTPSCEDVVQNIINISQSAFSDFKLFSKYSEKCKPTRREHYSLIDVLLECFQFLQEQRCEIGILQKLQRVACIPVSQTGRAVEITDPILVEPLSVVSTHPSIEEFFPILCPLPNALTDVLSVLREIGVECEIRVPQIWHSLYTIHQHIQFPLDPNYAKIVKLLLKRLYSLMKSTEILTTNLSCPLYLPDEDGRLVESRYLLYDDRHHYANTHFKLSHLKYSIFSLLVDPSEELEFYGFFTEDFYHELPVCLRPLSLSANCVDQLHESCRPWPVEKQSDFATKLKKKIAMTQFSECVCRILQRKTTMKFKEACSTFSYTLKTFLEKLEIHTVSTLTANVYLHSISPENKLGTARVDFLLQEEEGEGHYSLFLDKEADSLKMGLLDNLTESLVRCVGKLSGVDTSYFREPEKAIELVLRASTPAELQKILQGVGVKTSDLTMSFDESPDLNFNPKIGAVIPKVWHHRLQSDINNHFRPQELAGLEEAEDHYIYVRVEHLMEKLPNSDSVHNETDGTSQLKDHLSDQEETSTHKEGKSYQQVDQIYDQGYDKNDQEGAWTKLDEYLICVNDDDKETRVVSVIDLFKIMSIKLNDDATDLVLYHTEGENVMALKHDNLKEIMKEICSGLRQIWKLSDPDQRRKAVKGLYLKWHPYKNLHPLANEAFQFLKYQIKRLDNGLPLEDQGENWTEQNTTPLEAPYWEEYFQIWDDIAVDHGNTRKNEKKKIETQIKEGVTVKDLDPTIHFQVCPDPARAKVWLKQAEYDLEAVHVLLNNADDEVTDKVSAHACFLACQVAEKSLKAGMYQVFGIRELTHYFCGYAEALEQENKQQMQGLSAAARCLVHYYSKTRYPDYYRPPAAPSDKFFKDEADRAEKNARLIVGMVQSLVKNDD